MKPLSEVKALCCDRGLFVELADRVGRDVASMRYYAPNDSDPWPKWNPSMIGYGYEHLEVVDSFFGPHFEETDLFIFFDTGFGWLQEHLLGLGKMVWGSRTADELELSREFCKRELKAAGLPVGPYEIVQGMEALREHLQSHENVYVKVDSRIRGNCESFFAKNYKLVEPLLDEMEFQLGPLKELISFDVEEALPDRVEIGSDSYCVDGKTPSVHLAGIEVKDCCYAGRILEASKMPQAIQTVDQKMSPVMGRLGYRGLYSTEIRVGKDGIPYMIDFCFDDKTEVMTDSGWKLFKDCLENDKLATLNTETREIEYQKPSRYICHDWCGDMIRITNRKKTIECLVTPNHDVLRTDRDNKRIFKEKADALTDRGFIPRTGLWKGGRNTSFVLPEYYHEWDFFGKTGKFITKKFHHDPPKFIPMKTWASFMGWYLSEGSVGGLPKVAKHRVQHLVTITQTKYVDEVAGTLSAMPFDWDYNGKDFRINSTQLAVHLRQFGLCHQKFIPQCIKDSSPDVINEFLRTFALGDGITVKPDKNGYTSGQEYMTTSKRLADDLQEVIFKSGGVANIRIRKNAGTVGKFPGGNSYKRNHDIYIVSQTKRYNDFWFETGCRKGQFIKREKYNGKIYCATVPNGTLYVRRNGKPFWSGNCARAGNPPGFLYSEMYANFSEIIWQGANGSLIDPEPVAEWGVQLQFKSAWSADGKWQAINFDSKYRQQIKIANGCEIDGEFYHIPLHLGMAECGSVIGWGDSLEEAIKHCAEAAETIEGHDLSIKPEALEEAKGELEKAKEMGVDLLS